MNRLYIAVCVALLCLLMAGCGRAVQELPTSHTPVHPASARATSTATVAVASTPISERPSQIIYPKLGDTLEAWQRFYGQGYQLSAPGEILYQFSDTTFPRVSIVVGVEGDTIANITLTPLTGTWSNIVPFTVLALRYEPIDSVSVRTVQQKNGVAYLYSSNTLARALPSYDFTDIQGDGVLAGTYTVLFSPSLLPQRILLLAGDMSSTP